MIKFENTVTPSPEQWKSTIMGARNALNSWDRSDSTIKCIDYDSVNEMDICEYKLGPNDYNLLKRLRNAGTADHRKFMRMLPVIVDVTAPLYFWKEFDQYKIGTTTNSCSTMHCIHKKPFNISDFSTDHLGIVYVSDNDEISHKAEEEFCTNENGYRDFSLLPENTLMHTIVVLNKCREKYLETKNKVYWWQMIQLLPTSYNQKRTVMLNYEVLANIYKSRTGHKLDEWSIGFIDWIKSLPYSELITGEDK